MNILRKHVCFNERYQIGGTLPRTDSMPTRILRFTIGCVEPSQQLLLIGSHSLCQDNNPLKQRLLSFLKETLFFLLKSSPNRIDGNICYIGKSNDFIDVKAV